MEGAKSVKASTILVDFIFGSPVGNLAPGCARSPPLIAVEKMYQVQSKRTPNGATYGDEGIARSRLFHEGW